MSRIDLLDDLLDVPSTLEDPTELERYAAAAREEGAEAPSQDSGARRPVRGPCSLCSKPAERRCLRCERAVCARHHHVMFGLCTECTQQETDPLDAAEASADPDDRFADTRERVHAELDVDWIE